MTNGKSFSWTSRKREQSREEYRIFYYFRFIWFSSLQTFQGNFRTIGPRSGIFGWVESVMDTRDASRKFRSDDSILTEISAASSIGCNVSAKNRSITNNWRRYSLTNTSFSSQLWLYASDKSQTDSQEAVWFTSENHTMLWLDWAVSNRVQLTNGLPETSCVNNVKLACLHLTCWTLVDNWRFLVPPANSFAFALWIVTNLQSYLCIAEITEWSLRMLW